MIARRYLDGQGPFQQRLPVSGMDVTAGFSRIVAAASDPDLGIASDPAVP